MRDGLAMTNMSDDTLRVRIVNPQGEVEQEACILKGGVVRVGRNPDQDFVLPHSAKSAGREHAMFRQVDGAWYIFDHSRNGTYHNGEWYHHAATGPLRPSDTVAMGEVELVIEPVHTEPGPSPIDVAQPIFSRPSSLHRGPEFAPPIDEDEIDMRNVQLPQIKGGLSILKQYAVVEAELSRLYRATRSPEGEAPVVDEDKRPGADPDAEQPRTPGEAQPSDEKAQSLPSTDGSKLIEAFLAGAGVRQLPPDIEPATALRTLGEASRVIVASLAVILEARRKFKHSFRLHQTVIGGRDNNPLKFAADEEEMVLALLGKPRPGYVSGARAVSEAAADLVRHQRATIAGFEAVIETIFSRLTPARIEAMTGKPNRLLPNDRFRQVYARAFADLREDYRDMLTGKLNEVFANAYDRHAPAGGIERTQEE